MQNKRVIRLLTGLITASMLFGSTTALAAGVSSSSFSANVSAASKQYDPLQTTQAEPASASSSWTDGSLTALQKKGVLTLANTSYKLSDIFTVNYRVSADALYNVVNSDGLSVEADSSIASVSSDSISFKKSGTVTFRYQKFGIDKETTLFVNVTPVITTTKRVHANDTVLAKGIDLADVGSFGADFDKVKAAGIDFVIIRAGYGTDGTPDSLFETYYADAHKAGLDVGAYYYSYAHDVATAQTEAAKMLNFAKGKKFEYPIYFDYEGASDAYNAAQEWGKPDNATLTSMAIAFINALKAGGYRGGVYADQNFLSTRYDMTQITGIYPVWLANYTSTAPDRSTYFQYGIWQNAGTVAFPGVTGNADTSNAYVDYPSEIEKSDLNGYSSTKTVAVKVTAAIKSTYAKNIAPDTSYPITTIADIKRVMSDGTSVPLDATEYAAHSSQWKMTMNPSTMGTMDSSGNVSFKSAGTIVVTYTDDSGNVRSALLPIKLNTSLDTVTITQKPDAILVPGKEYTIDQLKSMLTLTGTKMSGAAADMSGATIAIDSTGTNKMPVYTMVNDKFSICKDGNVPINVTVGDEAITTDAALKLNQPSSSNASIVPTSTSSKRIKGQARFPLTAEQTSKIAELNQYFTASFDYYVPGTTKGNYMQNFGVYGNNSDFGIKGVDFVIYQGCTSITSGAGTAGCQMTQTDDNWRVYDGGGYLWATAPAPSRDAWHKVTIKYEGADAYVYVDGVAVKWVSARTVKYHSADASAVPAATDAGKIVRPQSVWDRTQPDYTSFGPIGTLTSKSPYINPDVNFAASGISGDDWGIAYYDNVDISDNSGNKIVSWNCNGNNDTPSITASWQNQYLNGGDPVTNTPIFDYDVYKDPNSPVKTLTVSQKTNPAVVGTEYNMKDLFTVTATLEDGTVVDASDQAIATADGSVATISSGKITMLQSGDVTIAYRGVNQTVSVVAKAASTLLSVTAAQKASAIVSAGRDYTIDQVKAMFDFVGKVGDNVVDLSGATFAIDDTSGNQPVYTMGDGKFSICKDGTVPIKVTAQGQTVTVDAAMKITHPAQDASFMTGSDSIRRIGGSANLDMTSKDSDITQNTTVSFDYYAPSVDKGNYMQNYEVYGIGSNGHEDLFLQQGKTTINSGVGTSACDMTQTDDNWYLWNSAGYWWATAEAPSRDVWHHVVVTYTNDNVLFAVDGKNVSWTSVRTGKLNPDGSLARWNAGTKVENVQFGYKASKSPYFDSSTTFNPGTGSGNGYDGDPWGCACYDNLNVVSNNAVIASSDFNGTVPNGFNYSWMNYNLNSGSSVTDQPLYNYTIYKASNISLVSLTAGQKISPAIIGKAYSLSSLFQLTAGYSDNTSADVLSLVTPVVDSSVATISNGMITFLQSGEVSFTYTYGGTSKTATCAVTAQAPGKYSLENGESTTAGCFFSRQFGNVGPTASDSYTVSFDYRYPSSEVMIPKLESNGKISTYHVYAPYSYKVSSYLDPDITQNGKKITATINGQDYTVADELSGDVWHNFVVAVNSSNQVSIYLDGAPIKLGDSYAVTRGQAQPIDNFGFNGTLFGSDHIGCSFYDNLTLTVNGVKKLAYDFNDDTEDLYGDGFSVYRDGHEMNGTYALGYYSDNGISYDSGTLQTFTVTPKSALSLQIGQNYSLSDLADYAATLSDNRNAVMTMGKVTVTPATSSDATVSGDNITFNKAGSITLNYTFALLDGTKTTSQTYTVKDSSTTVAVTGVKLNKTAIVLKPAVVARLTAMITPTNATNKNVAWSTSDNKIVTVDSTGLITAITTGSAVVTATTEDGGYTTSCAVTVSTTTGSSASFSLTLTSKDGAAVAAAKLYSTDMSGDDILADIKGSGTKALPYTADISAPVQGEDGKYTQTITFADVPTDSYKLVVYADGKSVPIVQTVDATAGSTDLGTAVKTLYGDINGDGKITAADALQLKRYLAGKTSILTAGTEEEQAYALEVANVTKITSTTPSTDKLSSADVVQIQRFVAGSTSVLS